MPVAGREENEIFAIVGEISDQLDLFCRNALVTYACHFIHPPCDPDTGTNNYIHYNYYTCTQITDYTFIVMRVQQSFLIAHLQSVTCEYTSNGM